MRTRYRAQQIIIDTPRVGDDVIIHAAIQTVDLEDDKIINESPRTDYLHKLAEHIAIDCVTVYDPVLGKDITISIAGLHMAIQENVCNWIVDEYGAIKEGPLVWQS